MKIVFMGTPDFAVPSLEILFQNNIEIAAVITSPDKPSGRGLHLNESPIKIFAKSVGLKVLQPENLKDPEFLSVLSNLGADLQIVVAFRMLPESIWNMPPKGTINLHASLLPQYRGAAPIQRAIMNGETETGLTTFCLRHEIDTGQIIFQEKISISDEEDAGILHHRMMLAGATLILKTFYAMESGKFNLQDQAIKMGKGETLKKADKIFRQDCRINWNIHAREIHNLIRALSPSPGAWTELVSGSKTQEVKIWKSNVNQEIHDYSPGKIFIHSGNIVTVATKTGFLQINELQLAGKRKMNSTEFLKGYPLEISSFI